MSSPIAASPPAPARIDTDIALATARTALDGHFLADHLGWWRPTTHPVSWCRLVDGLDAPRLLTSPDLRVPGQAATAVRELHLQPEAVSLLPPVLQRRLKARTPLLRVGTPTVWEAAATAVVRQVVHRDQARAAFARLSSAFGAPALVGGQVRHAFPTAETVLVLTEDQLRGCGVGFKARTLRTLARWCLDTREHLAAEELHDALLGVPGIGPWTAAVTVCDRFSEFSFYPVGDLAVRAHARALWARDWSKAPEKFAAEWRAATAPHTAAITAFVLAEGVPSGA
jgi:DNA-3-methyladenine glycosylase II